MKKLIFMIVALSSLVTAHADVFEDLEKEAVLIKKYCVSGIGQVNEEASSVRNEVMKRIVYCRNGIRHVANDNDNDKFETQTAQTDGGVNPFDDSLKPRNCVFTDSFLKAMCGRSEYVYMEYLSATKRKKLSEFFRFVKSTSPQDSSIIDSCYPAPPELSKENGGKILKCNNFGIAIIRNDV